MAVRYNYVALIEQLMSNFNELDQGKKQIYLQKAMIKYPVGNHSFLCDGLPGYPHFSPISKLKFISKSVSGIS